MSEPTYTAHLVGGPANGETRDREGFDPARVIDVIVETPTGQHIPWPDGTSSEVMRGEPARYRLRPGRHPDGGRYYDYDPDTTWNKH